MISPFFSLQICVKNTSWRNGMFYVRTTKKSSLERMLKTFKPSHAWWCIPIIPSLKCLSRKIEFKVSLGCARNICLIKRNNLNHYSLSHVLKELKVLLIVFTNCSCWIHPVNGSWCLSQGVHHLLNDRMTDNIDCCG